jgi:hypothetical protein
METIGTCPPRWKIRVLNLYIPTIGLPIAGENMYTDPETTVHKSLTDT